MGGTRCTSLEPRVRLGAPLPDPSTGRVFHDFDLSQQMRVRVGLFDVQSLPPGAGSWLDPDPTLSYDGHHGPTRPWQAPDPRQVRRQRYRRAAR
jgi:hypothetical protein